MTQKSKRGIGKKPLFVEPPEADLERFQRLAAAMGITMRELVQTSLEPR